MCRRLEESLTYFLLFVFFRGGPVLVYCHNVVAVWNNTITRTCRNSFIKKKKNTSQNFHSEQNPAFHHHYILLKAHFASPEQLATKRVKVALQTPVVEMLQFLLWKCDRNQPLQVSSFTCTTSGHALSKLLGGREGAGRGHHS